MSIRTPQKYIYYALQLYSSGLSLRKTSQRLFPIIKRNHVSIWNWIQKYKPQKIIQKKMKVMEFIIDGTLLKLSNEYVWLCMVVAIEPIDKITLGIRISVERSMLVAERFIHELSTTYGKKKQSVSTDEGTWYPQACKFSIRVSSAFYL
jgi:putative transposase